jgi:hypothetical protein
MNSVMTLLLILRIINHKSKFKEFSAFKWISFHFCNYSMCVIMKYMQMYEKQFYVLDFFSQIFMIKSCWIKWVDVCLMVWNVSSVLRDRHCFTRAELLCFTRTFIRQLCFLCLSRHSQIFIFYVHLLIVICSMSSYFSWKLQIEKYKFCRIKLLKIDVQTFHLMKVLQCSPVINVRQDGFLLEVNQHHLLV